LLGDYRRAIAMSEEIENWADGTYPLALGWLRASGVRDLTAAGDLEAAAVKLKGAYQENLGDYSGFGPVLVRVADMELALAQQNPERVLEVGEGLLIDLERLDIVMYRAHVYALQGNALRMQRRLDEAVAAFQRAVEYAKPLPMRGVLWQTYAAWAELEHGRGNLETAQTLRANAREYVEYIAAHAGNPANRELFLAQPRVCALAPETAVKS